VAELEVLERIADFRAVLDRTRSGGGRVGLVPTMGYLHEGHLSHMRRSATENELTAVTIFVNPLQFGANEDLASYPRDLDRDLELCRSSGVDVVLAPSVEEMYPEPVLTTVSVAEVSARMEGAARPTHFAGVATVVAKLFNIAGPCRAYFGEKDYQQLAVVRKMARDLSAPVEVIGGATVREPDGLAMSSRNVYLTEDERAAAPVLHRALCAGRDAILAGERSGPAVAGLVRSAIEAEPYAGFDYAEVVDAATLTPLEALVPGTEVRLLAAARFGRPRLLDNVGAVVPGPT
jgi:pantoate--beta-alanine ligase